MKPHSGLDKERLILEEGIAFLEDETKGKDLWYALRLSFIMAAGIYIFHFVYDAVTEGKNLVAFVEDDPVKFLANWVFWFLMNAFMTWRNKSALKRKKAQLARWHEQYGLGEETAS